MVRVGPHYACRRYIGGPGAKGLTSRLVESAFEKMWYPKLDEMILNKGRPLKLVIFNCTIVEIELLCRRYNSDQLTILGTDFNKEMVQILQTFANDLGKQDMVTITIMNLVKIELESSKFDVVFSIMGPMLLPGHQQVFKEIQRLLTPDGWFGCLTPGRVPILEILRQARKHVFWTCGREREHMRRYDSASMRKWGTPGALKARLVEAQFDKVESISVASSLDLDRGYEVDETLTYIFDNPGLALVYEGGLTSQQVKDIREIVRTVFRERWCLMSETESLQKNPYMLAVAACGYKEKESY